MIPESTDGFLTVPDAVIAEIVGDVEPELTEDAVTKAVADAAPTRAQHRRLAQALRERPDLLTSGRPLGPSRMRQMFTTAVAAFHRSHPVRPSTAESMQLLVAIDGRRQPTLVGCLLPTIAISVAAERLGGSMPTSTETQGWGLPTAAARVLPPAAVDRG